MHSFVLQDWTTIRGGVATVTQAENDWLDLAPYQDVVFWIDVRESINTPTLALQTSPTADEALFAALIPGQAMSVTAQPNIQSAFMDTAKVPVVARFVRWQITGTATWDATFRIVVSANAPGL